MDSLYSHFIVMSNILVQHFFTYSTSMISLGSGLTEHSGPIVFFKMQGGIVRVQGDEFWHMSKVLRLTTNDR